MSVLAYCTALQPEVGHLFYAEEAARIVRHAGTTIHVPVLDLGQDPADVLARVDSLAQSIATEGQARSCS